MRRHSCANYTTEVQDVLPNRELLNQLIPDKLAGQVAIVSLNDDRRSYLLVSQIGTGRTAVAWKVQDSIGRTFALKFVLKNEYSTHSLDAEARWASSLGNVHFARIDYYGNLALKSDGTDLSAFYGVVVDWIDGQTLRMFLNDPSVVIDAPTFCALCRDFCQVLNELRSCDPQLTHNDLHDENILIQPQLQALSTAYEYHLKVIDTGQLKSIDRRDSLVDGWRNQASILENARNNSLSVAIKEIRDRLNWFQRTDQEWVVRHLCSLHNKMLACLPKLNPSEKRFVRDLPQLLRQMIDSDLSRRIDDPIQMYREVETLWRQSVESGPPPMTTPFDLPSAELIRSDRQLMTLFSDEYPRIDACRSNSPVYIYGPRGSGKSTILRSLSIKAILASENPKDELDKIPFLGVYLSSSQELRSRFWLMKEPDFEVLEGHLVRYFNLLLVEALVDTLDSVHTFALKPRFAETVGSLSTLSTSVAHACARSIRRRLCVDDFAVHYAGTSELTLLRHDIQRMRDSLWQRMLDKDEPKHRPDAQLVFDLVRDLESVWPTLLDRRVVFLIDDYSNQRIPRNLQRRLNQAITFSKQGSPLFKVTSEYDGVDLEGVQEGREVSEINVGFEYVSLTDQRRYRFLQNVLEKRFDYCEAPIDMASVLPLSNIEPVIPMAKAIRDAFQNGGRFYYNGLDTISDLCSGDFAMGIDVVRRIFEHAGVNWRAPGIIGPQKQDEAIRAYAKQEFEYIRHQSREGKLKYQIADRLCWLSKECILNIEVAKDKKLVPLVKNHIDVSESAMRDLERTYPESAQLFEELTQTGVLFPIQPSRAMEARDATRRFMVRRILLARYTTALGRFRPILVNNVQRLQWLLTDPSGFVANELKSVAGPDAETTIEHGSLAPAEGNSPSDRQLKLF